MKKYSISYPMSLQEHLEQTFQADHQRLMRALHDSLERESDLQRQLRRMKESLVAVALRLQVSSIALKEDEIAIIALRKEAEEARMKTILAQKQAADAAGIIDTLRLEISSLKRKLREIPADGKPLLAAASNHSALPPSVNLGVQADIEVDEMMAKGLDIPVLRNTGGNVGNATSFQKWKMQKFMWTPDTPNASEFHEKHTVDMLAEAATAAAMEDLAIIEKPTKTSLGKIKTLRSRNSSSHGHSRQGVSVSKSTTYLPSLDDREKWLANKDFVDNGINSETKMWGSPVIDRKNKGKLNIWTSAVPDKILSPLNSARQKSSRPASRESTPIIV